MQVVDCNRHWNVITIALTLASEEVLLFQAKQRDVAINKLLCIVLESPSESHQRG